SIRGDLPACQSSSNVLHNSSCRRSAERLRVCPSESWSAMDFCGLPLATDALQFSLDGCQGPAQPPGDLGVGVPFQFEQCDCPEVARQRIEQPTDLVSHLGGE